MKDYAKQFYSSKTWQRTRSTYRSYCGGLCERCLSAGVYKAGEIVHHKIHITEELIHNPEVTLSFDNLELLCRDCHAIEHSEDIKSGRYLNSIKAKQKEERRRYLVAEDGSVVMK